MLRKGRESARVLRRPPILRQLDQGLRMVQVAINVGMTPKTVRAIGRRLSALQGETTAQQRTGA